MYGSFVKLDVRWQGWWRAPACGVFELVRLFGYPELKI